MTWVTYRTADRAIVEEIEAQTDRGAALVAAAFVENRLLQAIKVRLDPNMTPEMAGRVFDGPHAPLSTFSAKVDLGHALQLYTYSTHKLLHEIRKIRNDFAHNMEPISFETQSNKDRCTGNILELLPVGSRESTEHIKHLSKQLGYPDQRLWSGTYEVWIDNIVTARQIYMRGVKDVLLLLSLAMDIFAQHRIVLPPLPDRSAQQPPHPARRSKRERKRREAPPESSPA